MVINVTTKRKGIEPQETANKALSPLPNPVTEMAQKKIFILPSQFSSNTKQDLAKRTELAQQTSAELKAFPLEELAFTEQSLDAALTAMGSSFPMELAKAQTLYDQSEFQLALETIENAKKNFKMHKCSKSTYYALKGNCLAALGEHFLALTNYYSAEKFENDSAKKAELFYQIAKSHMVLQQFDSAKPIIQMALEIRNLSGMQIKRFGELEKQILAVQISDLYGGMSFANEGFELNTTSDGSDLFNQLTEPDSEFLPQTPITTSLSEETEPPKFINPKDLELKPKTVETKTTEAPIKASKTKKKPRSVTNKYAALSADPSIASLSFADFNARVGEQFLSSGNILSAINHYKLARDNEQDPEKKARYCPG